MEKNCRGAEQETFRGIQTGQTDTHRGVFRKNKIS